MTQQPAQPIDTTGDSELVAVLRRARHAAAESREFFKMRGHHGLACAQQEQVDALDRLIAGQQHTEAMAAFYARTVED